VTRAGSDRVSRCLEAGADRVALRATDLWFRYPGTDRDALRGVSAEVRAGQHWVLLGPNGSGKSTFLRCTLGRLVPTRGRVEVLGRPRGEWRPRELARRVAVVAQEEALAFPLTVREVVAMGRYPHLGPWRRPGPADREAVDDALARCDLLALAHRTVDALSGGERQRVRIARALAQRPEVLVLDEPTTHLDVRHGMEILELVRRLARADGLTVVTVTHDLNLAARHADRVALLADGTLVTDGPPTEVLTPERLHEVFRWPIRVWRDGGGDLVLLPERTGDAP
jgi:iron complex transport system ATP-binding protein